METVAKIEGFDELTKALDNFSIQTERRIVHQALRGGARVIIKYAKENVPEGHSGRLKKSFMTKAGKSQRGKGHTLLVGTRRGKTFGFYAHMVEFGTATARARPFFRPAFDEHPTEILEAIAAHMTKAIPAAIKKGQK